MFGPGTQSLLNESLKKCQPTPSEASEKSMEVRILFLTIYSGASTSNMPLLKVLSTLTRKVIYQAWVALNEQR